MPHASIHRNKYKLVLHNIATAIETTCILFANRLRCENKSDRQDRRHSIFPISSRQVRLHSSDSSKPTYSFFTLVSSTLNRSPSGHENSGQSKISETKIVKLRARPRILHRLKNAPKLSPRSGARQKKSNLVPRVLSREGILGTRLEKVMPSASASPEKKKEILLLIKNKTRTAVINILKLHILIMT